MTRFEHVQAATRAVEGRCIDDNPLFQVVLDGKMTRRHYIAYLRESFHLVRHTSRTLALAGARLGDDRRELRTWFFEQAQEENGHDLFLIKDLRSLGEDPDRILDSVPMPGAWGLISQNYQMATYGNPVGILGVATATEGLGESRAAAFAAFLVERYGIPAAAVSFLRSHGGFDAKHLAQVRRAIDELVSDPRDLRDIVHARGMTFRYYGQLFLDVLSADPVAPAPEADAWTPELAMGMS